jgi:hypothetical protein
VFIESTSSEAGTVILRDTTDAPFTVGAVFDSVGENALINNLAFEGFSVGVLMTGRSGVVQNTRISDCPIGVHAVRAVDPGVVGCLINRSDLAGILSEDVADAVYWLNHIRDCNVAIDVVGPDYARIPTNLICRNGIGMRLADGADPDVWYNGIQDNRTNGVLLQSGARPVVVQNDIFDNGIDFEVDVYAVPLDTVINATTNYWSSVDTLEIAAHILDRADDPARGAFVEFKPVSPVIYFPVEVDVSRLCAAESPYDDDTVMRTLRSATSRLGAFRTSARPTAPRPAGSLR